MSKRPKQVSLFFDAAHSMSSEVVDFLYLVFHGLSDAVEARTSGFLTLHRETKFIIVDFAVTLSSPESFCVPFDITSEQLVELKWLMLNKHKRWFQSSCVKLPLVCMSSSWFLVSIYLIWILGSKLIRSNNQTRATLWVLETCLIVGLPLLIIILITASLSSNTYNKASRREDWTFEGTESIFSITLIFPWDFWFLLTSTDRPVLSEVWVTLPKKKQSDPRVPEQATHLISIQLPKRWFRILLNCAKLKFASCTSNFIGTNVWLPKNE